MHWQARSRGVATIIGGVLLAVAVMGLIAFIILALDQMKQVEMLAERVASERSLARIQAESVSGWWFVGPPLTSPGSLLVHLESRASQTLEVTGVAVVWSDGSYTVLDKRAPSLSTLGVAATLTFYDGSKLSVDRMPIGLPPGAKLDIVFNNYAQNRVPVIVSTSLSGPAIAVTAIPLGNYTVYYPTEAYKPAPAASLQAYTGHIAEDYTTTWRGLVKGLTLSTNTSKVASYTLANGVLVSGTAQSLEQADGNSLIVNSAPTRIVQFKVLQDNLVYATNFSNNVLATGEWNTSGGGWSWDTTYGYIDGGLYGSTQGLRPAITIAYPSSLALDTTTPYYILAHVKPPTTPSGKIAGIGLYNTATNEAYIIGTDSDQPTIAVYTASGYSQLSQGGTPIGSRNQWNTYLVYYDWSGFIHAEYYTPTSSYTLEVTDKTVTPNVFGLVVYGNNYDAYFDDFIVSKANPRWLNITVVANGVPQAGWTVELYDSSGLLVARNTTGSNGVASLDVLWQPIVWGASIKVYDSSGVLVADIRTVDYGFPGLYGGNSYTVNITTAYRVELVSESSVPVSLLQNITSLSVWYGFTVNQTVDYSLYTYNWGQGVWTLLATGSGATVSGNTSIDLSYVNPGNGSVLVKLVLVSTKPFQVSVDVLNTVYEFLSYNVFDALLVGVGGTRLIDVYSYSNNVLSYLYSIDVGSLFNGSTVFSYDTLRGYLVLANTSGVYVSNLTLNPVFSLVSSTCTTQPGPAAIEVVNTSTNSYAVVVRSDASYCIVDLASNTTIASGLVSVSGCSLSLSPPVVYMASARDPSAPGLFLVGYCSDTGRAVLLRGSITGTGVSWSIATMLPSSRPVGLVAENSSLLWMIVYGGGVYKIYYDSLSSTWSVTAANVSLPFTPIGPGDRLEVLDAYNLVFVRADYTSEIWVIPKS